MDGFELIRTLREHPEFSNIPIIVVTALAGEEIKRKVFELGANGYEVKLDRGRVLETIHKLIG